MTQTLKQQYERWKFLEQQATQGRWYAWLDDTRLQYSEVDETKYGWDSVISDGTLIDVNECIHQHVTEQDVIFISQIKEILAALSTALEIIEQQREAGIERPFLLEHVKHAQLHKCGLHSSVRAAIYAGMRMVITSLDHYRFAQSIIITDMRTNKQVFRHQWHYQTLLDKFYKYGNSN